MVGGQGRRWGEGRFSICLEAGGGGCQCRSCAQVPPCILSWAFFPALCCTPVPSRMDPLPTPGPSAGQEVVPDARDSWSTEGPRSDHQLELGWGRL